MGMLRTALPEILIALAFGILGAVLLLLAILRRLNRTRSGCGRIPADARRQPDPCLYSQEYLLSRTPPVPVTWDNPDIWLTEPDGTLVSSADLLPNHEYRVVCRIWNASFHPAFGVTVTCRFAEWGFSAGTEQPVELTANGAEHSAAIDIAPWMSTSASFRWRTPEQAGHFCLYVRCAHPDDVTTANNVGQENTRVVDVAQSSGVSLKALLTNPDAARATAVQFSFDAYEIPRGRDAFRVVQGQTRLATTSRRDPVTRRRLDLVRRLFALVGGQSLADAQRRTAHGAQGWILRIDGMPLDRTVRLAAGERRTVTLDLQHQPAGGAPPDRVLNVTARSERGDVIGGVTIRTNVGG